MPLSAGDKLGSYEILASLGAGGMGEVYRARDTKLDREVAIKVLPAALAQDPDRLARFEREAKVLASLNHPNIAQIYWVEERALVMELVPGETLKAPLPVATALNYAKQIAEALEAAHEKGIVHRDLKPGNIMVTPEGVVKVLDFGLAAVSPDSGSTSDPTNSPTLTMRATQAGMIMGTAAYMSPEQARGKAVDKRADIWAFGVVLYQMLTGQRPFQGEDLAETLASVMKDRPAFAPIPAQVRPLLESCLEKDPKKRLRDIGDAWRLLEVLPPAQPVPATGSRRAAWIPWAAAAALALACAWLAAVHFRETPPQPASVRFQVPPPEGGSFAANRLALSPDGRQLAFLARGKNGVAQLWVRPLDSLEARPLRGTEGAQFPFWSPDNRFLGFYSAGDKALKRIEVSGGPAQVVCNVNTVLGTDWSRDGVILFGEMDGLYRVPQAGGDAVRVTRADAAQGERYHAFPQILPDGRHFLYLTSFARDPAIFLASWDGKVKKRLAPSSAPFRYTGSPESGGSGHLLFLRNQALMAQRLDPNTWDLTGEPFLVVEHVGASIDPGYSASGSHALAYFSQDDLNSVAKQLTWFDRTGKVLGMLGAPGSYNNLALSHDGTSAAVVVSDGATGRIGSSIWLIDVARNIPAKFTLDQEPVMDPVWSPDGSRLAFANGTPDFSLYTKRSGNTGSEEPVQKPSGAERPCDWSPDGQTLMYTRWNPATKKWNLWFVSGMNGDAPGRKAAPYLESQFSTRQCQFSPGGQWVAYNSDEGGSGNEIYVQSFPAGGAKVRVSNGGGSQPRWRRDGKELFYMAPGGILMAVDVQSATSKFQTGIPHALFDSHMFLAESTSGRQTTALVFRYDVAPDGKRFLVNTNQAPAATAAPQGITVVLNWTAGLKK